MYSNGYTSSFPSYWNKTIDTALEEFVPDQATWKFERMGWTAFEIEGLEVETDGPGLTNSTLSPRTAATKSNTEVNRRILFITNQSTLSSTRSVS